MCVVMQGISHKHKGALALRYYTVNSDFKRAVMDRIEDRVQRDAAQRLRDVFFRAGPATPWYRADVTVEEFIAACNAALSSVKEVGLT